MRYYVLAFLSILIFAFGCTPKHPKVYDDYSVFISDSLLIEDFKTDIEILLSSEYVEADSSNKIVNSNSHVFIVDKMWSNYLDKSIDIDEYTQYKQDWGWINSSVSENIYDCEEVNIYNNAIPKLVEDIGMFENSSIVYLCNSTERVEASVFESSFYPYIYADTVYCIDKLNKIILDRFYLEVFNSPEVEIDFTGQGWNNAYLKLQEDFKHQFKLALEKETGKQVKFH